MAEVLITGVGMVTPLGRSPEEVLGRVLRGDVAARPHGFAGGLACPLVAAVDDFDAEPFFPENKTLRLMNRDALMAAVAARLALRDAGVAPEETYPAGEIGLYGSTGLSGLPIEDAARLVQYAAAENGSLDLARFGEVALKRIRPVLSFKILASMPICFVSILENLRGPNAVFTPWESQGAQAIAAGVRALRRGDVPCAVVGGCDVKTHILSLIALEQLGAFDSWVRDGRGCVPGEGAAFLVLEEDRRARDRGARAYARLGAETIAGLPDGGYEDFVSGDSLEAGNSTRSGSAVIAPKAHLGDLFAAAAAVQVAVAAEWVRRADPPRRAVARCHGFGGDPAAFLLEAP